MNVEGGILLSDAVGILRRRVGLCATVALGVVLATYWIAMALPNEYQSYATVLVEPQSVDPGLVAPGVPESNLNERLHLMTAQILSRPRLSEIIDDLGLYPDESDYLVREEVIDLMRSAVSVEPVIPEMDQATKGRRGELEINTFTISFKYRDPLLARDVAQRLANDFIQEHIDNRVTVSQKSLEFIGGELERLAESIQKVEAEIARVKEANPGRLPEDFQANQRRFERVLGDLAVARRSLALAQSDEDFYRSQVASAASLAAPNDDASPARRLELLKLALAEYEGRGFTDKHPDVVRTRIELEAVRKSIEEDQQQSADEGSQFSYMQQQSAAEARRAALRKQASAEEVARLENLATEIQQLLEATPAVAEQLDALQRQYEHLSASFQDFSNRRLEATVQAQLERRQLGEQFRVIEAAFVAPEPSSPNRILIIALGIFFGIALGGGVGVLAEAADTSVHSPRQLQSALRLPVLASIPRIVLESDRMRLRRRRLRMAAATAGIVLFSLTGGALTYLWVNGSPFGVAEETEDKAPKGG